jgi:hypothetical protein
MSFGTSNNEKTGPHCHVARPQTLRGLFGINTIDLENFHSPERLPDVLVKFAGRNPDFSI